MRNHKLSTPNIKVRIKSVRYTFCGATVHCFLTPESMWRTNDPYVLLADTAEKLGMQYAKHTQFSTNKEYSSWNTIYSNSDKYIYVPSDYEYHGMASLKGGDPNDVELAKKIAYQKAYRQFINFYYNCYYNLYDFVMAYARDVWYEQMAQLAKRWDETNCRIFEMVGRE